ncbi:hypothetical protein ABIC94_001375 [Variovorax paradoxus]|uniref:hypothetical protein n=1 Tax=Variovorax paradoxus TaxID=34073 RepID=UPI00339A89ED
MPIDRVPAPSQGIEVLEAAAPLFDLGSVLITPAVLAFLSKHAICPAALLSRHQQGDWGSVDHEDAKANDWALRSGARLMGVHVVDHVVIWVVTEVACSGNRASTRLLFPDEY